MKMFGIPNWLKLNRRDKCCFCALTTLFGFYILPIILANRYYQDDLSRSLYGVTGWTNDGRLLTEWIMKWLCGGTPIGDIFPLPLLLSILLLAYVLILYIRRNLPDLHAVCILLFVGFTVLSNPFMLSTLSYRYDCLTMIIALCAAFLPYVLPKQYALWKTFCFSFIMCMILFVTYQPCCGVYIGLCVLELLFMILASKVNLLQITVRAGALCISVPIYYFVIMKRYISTGGWQEQAYRLSFTAGLNFVDSVMQNLSDFKMRMNSYIVSVPSPILLIMALLTAGGMLCMIAGIWKANASFRMIKILYIVFVPFLLIAGAILPLVVLTPSIFTISAHTLISLCGFGLWIGISVYFVSRRFEKSVVLLLIPCVLFSFTYSYTYGNALESQKQYEEYISYNIVHDVETINADGQYHYLTIDGKVSRSKEVLMLCSKYPLYRHLIPIYLDNSSYIGGALLHHYMQDDLKHTDLTPEDQSLLETADPLLHNSIYSCYVNEDKIIIHFNKQPQ